MKVLSLFDGMSCGQIALKQIGIIPEVYYASEIDKYAIKQTQLNFPNTIQLGDVTKINVNQLKKIDLLIGGSPCQSFSFAGKRVGMSTIDKEEIYTLERYLELKKEGFQFEGESYLFWEYMRILTDIRKYNPNVLFLLENVEMGKKWERVLSEAVGVYGVHINSALVSAQNRRRIYWTNIRTRSNGLFGELHSDIPQPKDKGIILKDILETEVDGKYYLSDKAISGMQLRKERNIKNGNGFGAQFPSVKSNTLLARCYKDGKENLICVAMQGNEVCLTPKRTEYGKAIRKDYETGRISERRKNIQQLEPREDGKTNCLTSVQKDNLILQRNRGKNRGAIFEYKTPTLSSHSWEQNNILCERQKRNYKSVGEKENALLSTSWKGSQANGMTLIGIERVRRLTPTECSRLQTIPNWYKWKCSDTQQYRMLGNGWTVDVIVHILSFMKEKLNINVA